MDAGIILGGQQPDILGAMDKGRAMAESQIGLNRQNALAELYRTQGAQIAAGDQNALNALAGFDPNASLGVQGNILGIQAQKQNMAFSAEEMQMKRDAAKASAAASLREQAATLTKEQLAQEQQALSEALSGGAFFYQNKDEAGYNAFLQSKGLDPAEFPFQAFPAHAATVEGVLEAMKAFEPPAAPKPQTEAAQLKADLDAGLIDQATYQAEIARRAPKGTSLTVDPATGQVTFQEGVGVTGSGAPKVGDVYNPNEVQNVVTMIDEIADNPNLSGVLGPIEGGGGNNIDDMSDIRRAYYGGDGTALIERIGQLQSNAWLSARAMLKGGGAITDYESRKAEGAVARLSRAKSEAEFRKALKDLRDAITEGEAKLRGGAATPPAAPVAAPTETPTETKPKRLKFNPATGELE